MKKVFLLITVILFGLGLASCAEKSRSSRSKIRNSL